MIVMKILTELGRCVLHFLGDILFDIFISAIGGEETIFYVGV